MLHFKVFAGLYLYEWYEHGVTQGKRENGPKTKGNECRGGINTV